jgi:hypothetical protein
MGEFCCSGSGFSGGFARAAVPAVVWFAHCMQWVFGFYEVCIARRLSVLRWDGGDS